MKLYATLNSDTSNKGQGGHRHLNAVFLYENEQRERIEVGKVKMKRYPNGKITITSDLPRKKILVKAKCQTCENGTRNCYDHNKIAE